MNIKEYNRAVDEFSDDLFRFALRYTGDTDESNDAVQDCFLALWEHHKEVKAKGVKGYLMRVLYRSLVDRHRHNAHLVVGIEQIREQSYSPYQQIDLHDQIEQMLLTLPEMQRTLLLLRDLEGYSYREMADITGLSQQQVMTYLYRARVRARKFFVDNPLNNCDHD